MLSMYPAIFYKEKDNGGYSVIFPDLNHLATGGGDLKEAFEMAVDCLAGYLYDLKCDEEVIPEPSELSEVDINSEYDDYESAFVNLISVDVKDYAEKHFKKSVTKRLTIPYWLNELAVENNINFSAVLQDALKSALHL